MNKDIIIEADRLYFKSLKKENATEKYCSWINDNEVNKFLETKKTTVDELKEYIDCRCEDPNCIFLGIFTKDGNEHIGNIKLEPIDFMNNQAILGVLIGEKDYWNKGYATEALKALIKYSFNHLNLNEIKLGVYKKNLGAVKAYKKAGFKIYDQNEIIYQLKVFKNK
jgi:RimJ/RimL family protein N-acetyltransferase